MPQAPKKKASRLSLEPVLDHDGDPKEIQVGKLRSHEREWMLAAYEHRINPEFCAALTGGKVEPTRRRLKILKRPPNNYLALWEEQRIHPKAFQNAPQFFTLTEKGERALREWDVELPPLFPGSPPRHQIMIDQGILDIKIAAKRHPELGLITASHILNHKETPKKTRDSETWYRFPCLYEGKARTICPDYFPLGFRRQFDPNVPIFIAFEFDTDSERGTKIAPKMESWAHVLKNETEYKHLGLPNLCIAWICPTARRLKYLQQRAAENVPKRLLPYFLFSTFPLYDSPTKPVPDGRLLEGDYQRVGLRPFNILTSATIE